MGYVTTTVVWTTVSTAAGQHMMPRVAACLGSQGGSVLHISAEKQPVEYLVCCLRCGQCGFLHSSAASVPVTHLCPSAPRVAHRNAAPAAMSS